MRNYIPIKRQIVVKIVAIITLCAFVFNDISFAIEIRNNGRLLAPVSKIHEQALHWDAALVCVNELVGEVLVRFGTELSAKGLKELLEIEDVRNNLADLPLRFGALQKYNNSYVIPYVPEKGLPMSLRFCLTGKDTPLSPIEKNLSMKETGDKRVRIEVLYDNGNIPAAGPVNGMRPSEKGYEDNAAFDDLLDTLIIAAYRASKLGQKIVLAIDNRWLTEDLKSSAKKIADEVGKIEGLKNILVIRGEGVELAKELADVAKDAQKISKVIVFGCEWSIDKVETMLKTRKYDGDVVLAKVEYAKLWDVSEIPFFSMLKGVVGRCFGKNMNKDMPFVEFLKYECDGADEGTRVTAVPAEIAPDGDLASSPALVNRPRFRVKKDMLCDGLMKVLFGLYTYDMWIEKHGEGIARPFRERIASHFRKMEEHMNAADPWGIYCVMKQHMKVRGELKRSMKELAEKVEDKRLFGDIYRLLFSAEIKQLNEMEKRLSEICWDIVYGPADRMKKIAGNIFRWVADYAKDFVRKKGVVRGTYSGQGGENASLTDEERTALIEGYKKRGSLKTVLAAVGSGEITVIDIVDSIAGDIRETLRGEGKSDEEIDPVKDILALRKDISRSEKDERRKKGIFCETMTQKQWEVMGFLAKGLDDSEIAGVMGVDEKSVKRQIGNIKKKLFMLVKNDRYDYRTLSAVIYKYHTLGIIRLPLYLWRSLQIKLDAKKNEMDLRFEKESVKMDRDEKFVEAYHKFVDAYDRVVIKELGIARADGKGKGLIIEDEVLPYVLEVINERRGRAPPILRDEFIESLIFQHERNCNMNMALEDRAKRDRVVEIFGKIRSLQNYGTIKEEYEINYGTLPDDEIFIRNLYSVYFTERLFLGQPLRLVRKREFPKFSRQYLERGLTNLLDELYKICEEKPPDVREKKYTSDLSKGISLDDLSGFLKDLLPLFRDENRFFDRDHCVRVAIMALAIARNLPSGLRKRLSDNDVKTLVFASLLHDLGYNDVDYKTMAGIRDLAKRNGITFTAKTSLVTKLYKKYDQLSPEEKECLQGADDCMYAAKNHPNRSIDILENEGFSVPPDVETLIRCHKNLNMLQNKEDMKMKLMLLVLKAADTVESSNNAAKLAVVYGVSLDPADEENCDTSTEDFLGKKLTKFRSRAFSVLGSRIAKHVIGMLREKCDPDFMRAVSDARESGKRLEEAFGKGYFESALPASGGNNVPTSPGGQRGSASGKGYGRSFFGLFGQRPRSYMRRSFSMDPILRSFGGYFTDPLDEGLGDLPSLFGGFGKGVAFFSDGIKAQMRGLKRAYDTRQDVDDWLREAVDKYPAIREAYETAIKYYSRADDFEKVKMFAASVAYAEKGYPTENMIAAAFLVDIPRESRKNYKNEMVNKLIDELIKAVELPYRYVVRTDRQKRNFRNMIMQLTEKSEVRALYVKYKLDRLEHISAEEAYYCDEILDIVTFVANKSGYYNMANEMREAAYIKFRKEEYDRVKSAIEKVMGKKYDKSEKYLIKVAAAAKEEIVKALKEKIKDFSEDVEVVGRVKKPISVLEKIKRRNKGKEIDLRQLPYYLEDIYDVFALRVICEKESTLWEVLDVLREKRILGEIVGDSFNNYVHFPKKTGYQALHKTYTHVLRRDVLGRPVKSIPIEVQIKTRKMHKESQKGKATHFKYKDIRLRSSYPAARELPSSPEGIYVLTDYLGKDAEANSLVVRFPLIHVRDGKESLRPTILDLLCSSEIDLLDGTVDFSSISFAGQQVKTSKISIEQPLSNGDWVKVGRRAVVSSANEKDIENARAFIREKNLPLKVKTTLRARLLDELGSREKGEAEARGRRIIEGWIGRKGRRIEVSTSSERTEAVAFQFGLKGLNEICGAVGCGLLQETDFIEVETSMLQTDEMIKFGANGWRGKIGTGERCVNDDRAKACAQLLSDHIVKNQLPQDIIVAFGAREASEDLAAAVSGVFAANGIRVWFVKEPVTAPEAVYAIKALEDSKDVEVSGTVMIDASNVPKDYNGIKFYDARTLAPASKKITDELEKIGKVRSINNLSWDAAVKREMIRYFDPSEEYVNYLLRQVDVEKVIKAGEKGLKIIVDPIHGPGGRVWKKILRRIEEMYGKKVLVARRRGKRKNEKEFEGMFKLVNSEPAGDFGGLSPKPAHENFEKGGALNEAKSFFGPSKNGLIVSGGLDYARNHIAYYNGSTWDSPGPYELSAVLLMEFFTQECSKPAFSADKYVVIIPEGASWKVKYIAGHFGVLPQNIIEVPSGYKNVIKEIRSAENRGEIPIAVDESGGVTVHGVHPIKDGILMNWKFIELFCDRDINVIERDISDVIGFVKHAQESVEDLSPETKTAILRFFNRMHDVITRRAGHGQGAFLDDIKVTFDGAYLDKTTNAIKLVSEKDGCWLSVIFSEEEPCVRVSTEGISMKSGEEARARRDKVKEWALDRINEIRRLEEPFDGYRMHHFPRYIWDKVGKRLRHILLWKYIENETGVIASGENTSQDVVDACKRVLGGQGMSRLDEKGNIIIEKCLIPIITDILNEILDRGPPVVGRFDKKPALKPADVENYFELHEIFHQTIKKHSGIVLDLLGRLKSLPDYEKIKQDFANNYNEKYKEKNNELLFAEELMVVYLTETTLLGQLPKLLPELAEKDAVSLREERYPVPGYVIDVLSEFVPVILASKDTPGVSSSGTAVGKIVKEIETYLKETKKVPLLNRRVEGEEPGKKVLVKTFDEEGVFDKDSELYKRKRRELNGELFDEDGNFLYRRAEKMLLDVLNEIAGRDEDAEDLIEKLGETIQYNGLSSDGVGMVLGWMKPFYVFSREGQEKDFDNFMTLRFSRSLEEQDRAEEIKKKIIDDQAYTVKVVTDIIKERQVDYLNVAAADLAVFNELLYGTFLEAYNKLIGNGGESVNVGNFRRKFWDIYIKVSRDEQDLDRCVSNDSDPCTHHFPLKVWKRLKEELEELVKATGTSPAMRAAAERVLAGGGISRIGADGDIVIEELLIPKVAEVLNIVLDRGPPTDDKQDRKPEITEEEVLHYLGFHETVHQIIRKNKDLISGDNGLLKKLADMPYFKRVKEGFARNYGKKYKDNDLFAEELLTIHMTEKGALRQDHRLYVLDGADGEEMVPAELAVLLDEYVEIIRKNAEIAKNIKKILVVDDEEIMRKIIVAMLERHGFKDSEIVIACDGEEGLKKFEKEKGKFDLVISDWEMPRMNGIDLIKGIKDISSRSYIILNSGRTEEDYSEIKDKPGEDDFVCKAAGMTAYFFPLLRAEAAAGVRRYSDEGFLERLIVVTDGFKINRNGEDNYRRGFADATYGPWVQSPIDLIYKMLRGTGVKNKKFIDLGSGDGTVAVIAAKLGATVRGVEKDDYIYGKSEELVKELGNEREIDSSMIDLTKGDFMEEDLGQYDIVYYYDHGKRGQEELVRKLLRELKSDAKLLLLSHAPPGQHFDFVDTDLEELSVTKEVVGGITYYLYEYRAKTLASLRERFTAGLELASGADPEHAYVLAPETALLACVWPDKVPVLVLVTEEQEALLRRGMSDAQKKNKNIIIETIKNKDSISELEGKIYGFLAGLKHGTKVSFLAMKERKFSAVSLEQVILSDVEKLKLLLDNIGVRIIDNADEVFRALQAFARAV